MYQLYLKYNPYVHHYVCLLLSIVMIFVSIPATTVFAVSDSSDIEGMVPLDLLKATGSTHSSAMIDNAEILVGGVVYGSGIALIPEANGAATLSYSVDGMDVERFYAVVGPQGEGSAVFSVYAGGELLVQSPTVSTGQSYELATDIPQGNTTVTIKIVGATGNSAMNLANAGFYYTASAQREGAIYLSDMVMISQQSLDGVRLDKNNEGNGSISIEGRTFEKGLSTHPAPAEPAVIIYDITNSGAETFSTWVGQCDTANYGGNGVDCMIYVDGEEVYRQTFQYDTPAEHVQVSVAGASQLMLKLDNRGDLSSDSFSFGDAKLVLNSTVPVQTGSVAKIDLTEYAWKAGASNGEITVNRALESDKPLIVGGKTYAKGIGLHPVGPTQSAYVEYDISSFNADVFTVKVGKTKEDTWSNPSPQFTVRFRIYGDGRLLKETRPVVYGEFLPISVDVKGITTLRMEVDPDGDYTCDCSAFCEPTLLYETGIGKLHITSPYIKDSTALENRKSITVEGIAPGVEKIRVLVNGTEATVPVTRSENGDFSFTLSEFAQSDNLITVLGYVGEQLTSQNILKFRLLGGNVLNLFDMDPYYVDTNGRISFGTNLYNGKYLSIGSGALTTTKGFTVQPNTGSMGEFEVIYDLSLLPEHRYFRVTVGRDDWVKGVGNAICYVLSDAPGIETPVLAESRVLSNGAYEILSCEIPEGTTKLTLLTSNDNGDNTSDFIDWFEPMLFKSKEFSYATAQTAMPASADSHVVAKPLYSFATRFTTFQTSTGLSFTAIGEQAEITAKLYRFLYSRNRSMQEVALVEQTLAPDANGVYTLTYLTQCDPGEYLLVLEGVKSIVYAPCEQGKVYIDGTCIDGFADLSVHFMNYADTYFGSVSAEGESFSETQATSEEKTRARTQFEGYLSDLTTFPSSVTIGGTSYQGFGSDFTVKDTKKSADDKRETTVITMEHTSGLSFELTAVLYPDYAAFDWVIYFTNLTDENSPIVTDFNVMDMDFAGEDPYFFTSHGETPHITPYIPLHYHLNEGDSYFFDANTGRSSEEDSFPYYNLEYGDQGATVAIGWPAWWETTISAPTADSMNMVASQSTLHAYLEPGETLRTPLMAMVLYDGRDTQRATNLWRRWLIDCNMYTEDNTYMEPGICGHTNWVYHEMLNTTEQQQLNALSKYKEYGIDLDYWWMDAGWYNLPDMAWKEGSPWLYSGNWDVDTERFPTGLESIGEYAEGNGIKNILWFEPERVGLTPDQLDEMAGDGTIKKEWLVGYEGHEDLINSWAPYNILDLSDPEAVDWLIGQVSKVLENANITVYREDFNVAATPAWGTQDGVGDGFLNRNGITENKYVQGHLRYWDALLALDCVEMIDTCASGGHRLDLETLRRAVALHPADYNFDDQASKQTMTYSIGQWVPYNGGQVGYDVLNADKYHLRSSYRPLVAMGYNVLSSEFSATDAAVVKDIIAEYKTIDDYYYDDLYQLTDWNVSPDRWYSYEYLNAEQSKGYAMVYRREGGNAPSQQYIRFKGLQEDKVYTVEFADAGKFVTLTGKEAMEKGVLVTLNTANSSELLYIMPKTEDSDAIQQVETLIAQIGVVTKNSGDAIAAAQQAYDMLSAENRELVTNYDVLVSAQQRYQWLKSLVYGDVNQDTKIDASDALDILKQCVGKIVLDEKQSEAADADGDRVVTAADALYVLKWVVGKIKSFPVEGL